LRTLLGFDFGLQRTGVAVGQDVTGTATALETLRSHNGQPDWDALSGLIDSWQPDALIVGLSTHADGSDSKITPAIRAFARQLEQRYRLPVHFMDERLSSHAAAGSMNRPGQQGSGIDAVAAMIILQDWLAQQGKPE